MVKILVLGSNGRLAAALLRAWASSHEVRGVSRREVDVADAAALGRFLAGADFDILVNGTGMTNVDACETERELARRVNADAPEVMARAATARGARLIHFSTDYVFDGATPRPLVESDEPIPLGWYGETKLAGEQRVLEESDRHVVARVSWVFGPDKPSFIDMILDRAKTEAVVTAVADKWSLPTFAPDVATWMEPFFAPETAGGLFHACNSGEGCSWRDYGAFALACAKEAGWPLAARDVDPISLADLKAFIAPRPVHTVLSTEKLAEVTGITPRPWQDAVREYVLGRHA